MARATFRNGRSCMTSAALVAAALALQACASPAIDRSAPGFDEARHERELSGCQNKAAGKRIGEVFKGILAGAIILPLAIFAGNHGRGSRTDRESGLAMLAAAGAGAVIGGAAAATGMGGTASRCLHRREYPVAGS